MSHSPTWIGISVFSRFSVVAADEFLQALKHRSNYNGDIVVGGSGISSELNRDNNNEIGVKKSSAQLTKNYDIEQLLYKQIAGVINFPKKQIGDLISEVLVLGFPDSNDEPILISPDKKLVNGGQLY